MATGSHRKRTTMHCFLLFNDSVRFVCFFFFLLLYILSTEWKRSVLNWGENLERWRDERKMRSIGAAAAAPYTGKKKGNKIEKPKCCGCYALPQKNIWESHMRRCAVLVPLVGNRAVRTEMAAARKSIYGLEIIFFVSFSRSASDRVSPTFKASPTLYTFP